MGTNPVLSIFPAGHRLAGRPAWHLDGVLVPVVSGGDGPTVTATAKPGLLDKLAAARDSHVEKLGKLLVDQEEQRAKFEALPKPDASATEEQRAAYTKAETELRESEAKFKAEWDPTMVEVTALEGRLADHALVADRRAKATKGPSYVKSEPLTYNRYNAREHSYFIDLAAALIPQLDLRKTNRDDALDRLRRHAKEMDVELPARAQRREQAAEMQMRGRLGEAAPSPFEKRVNPNRTDGQGGYFVPPLWLIDEYIPYLRAGRETANLCVQMDLPEGTDSINIPKLATGTLTGVQGADNAGVTSQDYTDTSVQANVKTIAGQEDVAIQLIEQSPGQIVDQVLMKDLLADYNLRVDQQVLNGTGAQSSALNGGSLLGLYPYTNWSATQVDWPTSFGTAGYNMMQKCGVAISQIAQKRFSVANVKLAMHPRRWFWFATSLDGNDRPLVVPGQYGPWNAAGIPSQVQAEGLVGDVLPGFPSYIDANVTTADTSDSGSAQDAIIAAKWDDCWLFEGELRTRVLPEILSGTLQLRYQVYSYLAFLVRYGQSVAIITGSAMGAPAGGY